MSKTMEELRVADEQRIQNEETEQARLQEKILCAKVVFPVPMQRLTGWTHVYMELSELNDYLEEQYENEERGVFTVQITKRTRKWLENLPELD